MQFRENKYSLNIFVSQKDEHGYLKLSTILDCFQEAALLDIEENSFYKDSHLTDKYKWIVSKTKFDIIKKSIGLKKIIIVTKPYLVTKVKFYRSYQIFDENDNLLIEGVSLWALIDKTNNFPVAFPFVKKECSDINVDKIKNIFIPIPFYDTSFELRRNELTGVSDHDTLLHVNNAFYLNFVYNSLKISERNYKNIQIEYLNQLFANQKLALYFKKVNNTLYFYGLVETNIIFRGSIYYE